MTNTNNLVGKKEITTYCRRSWTTIRAWIKTENFPAKKMDGVWESDVRLIDEWKMEKIKKPCQE